MIGYLITSQCTVLAHAIYYRAYQSTQQAGATTGSDTVIGAHTNISNSSNSSDCSTGGSGSSSSSSSDVWGKSAALVREQMNILVLGLDEVARQVSHHCVERGHLLDKVNYYIIVHYA
jgi:hypothetical protein